MFRILLQYLLLFLVTRIDCATGAEVKLGSVYLLTVAIASWTLQPRALVIFAVATVVMWSGAEWLNGVHYTKPWLYSWNFCNRLGVVSITAGMVAKAKTTLTHQQLLIRELRQTLLKISQFKELVPICRICHQSHVNPEYKLKLDEILRDKDEQETVGGICADCLAARAERLDHIPVDSYFQARTS